MSTNTLTTREQELYEILAHVGLQIERIGEPGSLCYMVTHVNYACHREQRSIEDLERTAAIIMGNTGECCLCGELYYAGGCNPEPLMPLNDGKNRCCHECDVTRVRQARFAQFATA